MHYCTVPSGHGSSLGIRFVLDGWADTPLPGGLLYEGVTGRFIPSSMNAHPSMSLFNLI